MTPARTSDPALIEHRLLDLAYTTDIVITVPALAFYAPCSLEAAEHVLDRLASEGRIEIDVDDDGNLSYRLPNRQHIAAPHPLLRQVETDLEQRHAPNAAAAAVLSMIVPGAGQLYAGRPLSAVAWFVLVTMGYLLLIAPGVMLHILCVASAASAAHHWRPSMA